MFSLSAVVRTLPWRSQRVGHVLKGMREKAFYLFLLKLPADITSLLSRCQNRKVNRLYRLLPSTFPANFKLNYSFPSREELRAIVREAVREEHSPRKGSAQPYLTQHYPTIRKPKREELATFYEQILTLTSISCSRPNYSEVCGQLPIPVILIPATIPRWDIVVAETPPNFQL